jgi:hypothetical protein
MAVAAVLGLVKAGGPGAVIAAIVMLFVAIHLTAIVALVRLVRGLGALADVRWILVSLAILVARELPTDTRLTVSFPIDRGRSSWHLGAHYLPPGEPVEVGCTIEAPNFAVANAIVAHAGCRPNAAAPVQLAVRLTIEVDETYCYLPLYTRIDTRVRMDITGRVAGGAPHTIQPLHLEHERAILGIYACATLRSEVGRDIGAKLQQPILGAASFMRNEAARRSR